MARLQLAHYPTTGLVVAVARIPWSASCFAVVTQHRCFAVVTKHRCVAVEIAGAAAPCCHVVGVGKCPDADFALDGAASPRFPSAAADAAAGAVTIDQVAVAAAVAVVGKKNWSRACNREQSSMLSRCCCDLKSNRKNRSREL